MRVLYCLIIIISSPFNVLNSPEVSLVSGELQDWLQTAMTSVSGSASPFHVAHTASLISGMKSACSCHQSYIIKRVWLTVGPAVAADSNCKCQQFCFPLSRCRHCFSDIRHEIRMLMPKEQQNQQARLTVGPAVTLGNASCSRVLVLSVSDARGFYLESKINRVV